MYLHQRQVARQSLNYTNWPPDEDPDMVNHRDSVINRLLLACRQNLSERGMVGMFVDGSRYDENVLLSLGKDENPNSYVCTFSLVVS